jgi:hypothetical protein
VAFKLGYRPDKSSCEDTFGHARADEKMTRIGSGMVSVLVILWMLPNSGNITGPDHDVDSGASRSWPQIIPAWIGEITIAVSLVVGAFYVYAKWDNWRVRRGNEEPPSRQRTRL